VTCPILEAGLAGVRPVEPEPRGAAVHASEEVVELAGGAWSASLNHFLANGRMVTTVQVDVHVYVVAPRDFNVAHYSLGAWLGEADHRDPTLIECVDAETAWDTLQFVREGCYLWQCGGCDGWIYTSDRPRVGVLRCSTCGSGGVDFRHADRHVGRDDE